MTDPHTTVVVIRHSRRGALPHTPDEPAGPPGGPPVDGTAGAVARLRPAGTTVRFRRPRRLARWVHGPRRGNERGRNACRGAGGAAPR
ncbi:hypothetical protein E2C00_02995 [Streptomyces sp. WAC05374]|uniref:hypothetical protein n=1 Tax=Streptomyces sp. WAC05374 TaxID=2487420 RepID=UPI0010550CA6|nr:hypothetical protein [Streptomyces sp. WAC05374]TDF50468.1 hypothetical protein E2B92_02975 [Streptomyces sp. WAC05374]TDF51836.1 hypothetical protein E2C02_23160 [Streptomyces sp. WAC05374]TDF60722.1 hypothetical protein E2C00_02995 [Streptomyces sp. WAC05374]